MARAVVNAAELLILRSYTVERLAALARQQNAKAHEALDAMTEAPIAPLLGPLQAVAERAIINQPVTEAMERADKSMAVAELNNSKQAFERGYLDSALAVREIIEQDKSHKLQWDKYVIKPLQENVVNPTMKVAGKVADKAESLVKEAASGLNQTLLLLGIAYIAIQATQKTITGR